MMNKIIINKIIKYYLNINLNFINNFEFKKKNTKSFYKHYI